MNEARAPTDENVRAQVLTEYRNGVKPKALSEKTGISVNTIKSWIKRDKARSKDAQEDAPQKKEGAPSKRKRGAPTGNKNAAESGAPKGNQNAMKHGGYSAVYWDALSDEEKEMIKKQIVFMKQYRSLFQFGTFYRLKSPFEGNETAWMVVSKERDLAIVGYYRTLQEVNVGYRRLLLEGLDENKVYHVNDLDLYGDELMNVGLIISDSSCGENKDGIGDYYSKLYILKEKKENE